MTSSFMLDVMGSIKFVEIYSNKSHFHVKITESTLYRVDN